MIRNGCDWFDVNGRRISAHAGGISRFEDTYYWYGDEMENNPGGMFNQRVYQPGEDPATWKRFFDGYAVYTSTNLVDWTYRGKALSRPERGFCSLYISGRPHVIHNESTGKYVMYHYYYPIYPGCLLMAAVADSPLGPFEHVGVVESGSFCGHVGDMNVFKDDDGSAYVIYDDTGFNIRIDRLSDDYLTSLKDGILVMPRIQEAPAMVKYRGRYLVAGSSAEGFDPTETTIVIADSPLGPYSEKQVISQENTWKSQITDMVVVPEGDYIMVMCDQWLIPDPEDIAKSRYLWLPLEHHSDSDRWSLTYREEWDPMDPFQTGG